MSTRAKYRVFERRFTPAVYKALQVQIKDVVNILESQGVDAAKRFNDTVLMNDRMGVVIRDLYKTVGLFFANNSYENIQKQVKRKGFGFNLEWTNEILNYFRLYLLSKAVIPITETTKEFIRQILEQGEREGWGIDKMAYELTNSEISLNRARVITRTETAKAAFKGRELAYDKSPYKLTLEWIAADDHRTRHSHRQIDGVVIEDSGRFQVPVYKRVGKVDMQIGVDLMKGPGDPNAHKENVINCRCTTAERVVFDEAGDPVIKNGVRV